MTPDDKTKNNDCYFCHVFIDLHIKITIQVHNSSTCNCSAETVRGATGFRMTFNLRQPLAFPAENSRRGLQSPPRTRECKHGETRKPHRQQ